MRRQTILLFLSVGLKPLVSETDVYTQDGTVFIGDDVKNSENDLKLPWKHIVERIKIDAEEKRKKEIKRREQKDKEKEEAIKFMNTFFNDFFSESGSNVHRFDSFYEDIRDGNQLLRDEEDDPMITISHSLTVDNKTQEGVTSLPASSVGPIIRETLDHFLFSSEKTSSSSLGLLLSHLAPFLILAVPLLFLMGFIPVFTLLFLVIGLFAFSFLIPLLPLAGFFGLPLLMSEVFSLPDEGFSLVEAASKVDDIQPIIEAVTESVNISTVAEFVTNVPRTF